MLLAAGIPAADLDDGFAREQVARGLIHQFGQLARMLAASPAGVASFEDVARSLYRVSS